MLKLAKSALMIASVSMLISGVANRTIKLNLQSACNLVKVSEVQLCIAGLHSLIGKELVGVNNLGAPIGGLSDALFRTVTFNSPVPTGTMLVKTVPNNELKAFSVHDRE